MLNKIKKSISEFKEWVSPWYPTSHIDTSCGVTNCLDFKEYKGKRFVPREIRMFDKILPAILTYGSDEYVKKYKQPCTHFCIVLDLKDNISYNLYSLAGELELWFNFWWCDRKTWTVDTVIHEIVEKTWWTPGTLDIFTDDEGRLCRQELHYGPTDSGFITYLQGVS